MKFIKEIDDLTSQIFRERWALFSLGELVRPDLTFPGVYVLAFTSDDLKGSAVKPDQVLYVGMSNSAGGTRSRLKQFLAGIEDGKTHSGAMRFYREQCGGSPFSQLETRNNLYFAARTIECASEKVAAQPNDLRYMGHVACFEYYVIARIMEATGRKPPLNKYGPRCGASTGYSRLDRVC